MHACTRAHTPPPRVIGLRLRACGAECEKWLGLRVRSIQDPSSHDYTDHHYIGHGYIGHNYIGHHCIGHNYIGHNYIGHNDVGMDSTDLSGRCQRCVAHTGKTTSAPTRMQARV